MALNIDNSLGDVKPHVRPVAEEIDARWDMYNIWGVGGSQDHLLGLALDFMLYTRDGNSIRTQEGNEIAAYFVQNSNRLNVSYVIWRQRIWNPSRDPQGASWDNWRRMEDRGDPTQNHMDHVHVSFNATGTYLPPSGGGTPMPTSVKLSEVGPGKSAAANRVIQAALNNEFGGVAVDGDYGPQTTAAYKRWQAVVGAAAMPFDGLPGRVSLPPLGAKYGFTVDLGDGTSTPPVTPPEVTPIPGTVRFNYIGPGTQNDDNKIVQTALNREFGGVIVDGDWGNQTSAAYTRWQNKIGFTGADADGAPGRQSLTQLAAKYGFTVDWNTMPPAPPAGAEPAHNYSRTTYGGKTVNQRTKVMLQAAAKEFGGPLVLTQGSYNKGVAASAGTHDGGGCVDISVDGMSSSRRVFLVQCLRRAGFAAWLRTPSQGFAYHIHANAIGDREMAGVAKEQVQQYFNGQNGLSGHGADTNPPRPWPSWANKYNY